MATKRSATSVKKSPNKRAASSAAKTTTKVTTVRSATTARSRRLGTSGFSFSRSPLLAASIAEFVGAFVLAAVFLVSNGAPIYVLFALIAIVLMTGALSGAHINPALTVGAWVTRRVSSARAVSYLVAQVFGALLALVVVNAYVTSAPKPTSQLQAYGQSQQAQVYKVNAIPRGKEWGVLSAELVGTLLFAFAVSGVLLGKRDRLTSAFTMGGGYFVALLIAGTLLSYITATAVLNPAVALSLQAVSWSWWPIATYVLAPLVGGILGFGLYDLIRTESEDIV